MLKLCSQLYFDSLTVPRLILLESRSVTADHVYAPIAIAFRVPDVVIGLQGTLGFKEVIHWTSIKIEETFN
jgi:hypothetical protein